MDLFQLLGSTTLPARDDYVDVPGAKLSRPSLLQRVG
jgi:hypothetical protein